MKKFFAVLMLAAALILPGLAQAKDAQTSMIDDVVKRGVLRVGFSSFVPWAMQDKNGEFVGFEIDVAKRLAKDLGVELQLVPTKWAGIIPALMAGKFDVIIGSMSVTPERNLKANFTVPYDYATIEVMANKEKTKGMKFPEDFNKPEVVVALRTGSTPVPVAKKVLPNATFRLFDDEAPAVQDVLSGRADVMFSSAPLPAFEVLRNPDKLYQPSTDAFYRQPVGHGHPQGRSRQPECARQLDPHGRSGRLAPRAPSFLVQDDRLGSAASMSSGGSRKAFRREWSPYAEYGRQGRLFPTFGRVDAVLVVLLLLGACFFLWRSETIAAYRWSWPELADFLVRRTPGGYEPGLLIRGLIVTLRLGVWSMALALLIGGVLGALSAGKRGVAALPIQLFVNSVRNIPPLVLLFLLYFFAGNLLPVSDMEQALRSMPPFVRDAVAWGFAPEGQLDRMVAAVLTLGVYEGAYVTEIVRGGIEGVPHGQWEASAALGFSRSQQLRLVIFPQAVRAILPPLVGQVITTFKDSALASLISLPDLTFQALEVMAISRMTFEVWISAGAIYLLLGVLCARYGRWLETRETWKA